MNTPLSTSRRRFLEFAAASPLISIGNIMPAFAENVAAGFDLAAITAADETLNVFELREIAKTKIRPAPWAWLMTGSDDEKTLRANREIFDDLQIRVHRLIDVTNIDTSVEVFGRTYQSPIMLAPIGLQNLFHDGAEIATAKAAAKTKHLTMAGNLSSASYADIASYADPKPWLQLYTRWPRSFVADLLKKVEDAGCPAVALTVDVPVGGKRETIARLSYDLVTEQPLRFGNFPEDLQPLAPPNSALTWEYVDWLKNNTSMKVLIKGIVSVDDAKQALSAGVDGLYVSNHGGRQEASNRSALESLAVIAPIVKKKVPILVDGGIRRGTDIFKALAMGADLVAVGRPQVWGLGAFGQAGVEQVLNILQGELVRTMQLSGVTSLRAMNLHNIISTPNGRFGERYK
ncbi:alpha-hydroxy acid oxidase [Hyphococcus flavus]|uniref:Alpha-hydroxy acid oxidase n=1 Tax=Hyphococcus flavus TaxID=1866326 RepID=A0AAF0CEA4_9PROT|nr:alpha-hydroxy acid oxidase [Hyphococcus flavus]WDI30971.1 alpha-hydroxy acid oxidase [Hyphococcus flavus]